MRKMQYFFYSYSGAEFHDCAELSIRATSTQVSDMFLDFICCNNIYENTATNTYLRKFLATINSNCILPYTGELSQMMLDYSDRIHR